MRDWFDYPPADGCPTWVDHCWESADNSEDDLIILDFSKCYED